MEDESPQHVSLAIPPPRNYFAVWLLSMLVARWSRSARYCTMLFWNSCNWGFWPSSSTLPRCQTWKTMIWKYCLSILSKNLATQILLWMTPRYAMFGSDRLSMASRQSNAAIGTSSVHGRSSDTTRKTLLLFRSYYSARGTMLWIFGSIANISRYPPWLGLAKYTAY